MRIVKHRQRHSEKALTRIEVIILIGLILILLALLFPRSRGPHGHPPQCFNNLKEIGLAFRQWVIDRKGDFDFPMGVSTNSGGTREYIATSQMFRHFQIISNELLTPKFLVCPQDVRGTAKNFERLRNKNISYFVGVDAAEIHPAMFLIGDRNLTNGTLLPGGILVLKSNSIAGWTDKIHGGQGNIGLADSSVQSLSTSKLREALEATEVDTNRLALPLD